MEEARGHSSTSTSSSARRPRLGDLISYRPAQDVRGRTQARDVRHAGQRIEERRAASRMPRMAMGVAALAVISLAAAIGALPVGVAAVYGALSVVSYFMYAMDKSAANASRRRIPENQLHLFGLLGGWPGALVAQQQFRHKTAKASFRAHEALAGALH